VGVSGGFASAVILSASGLPTGLTAVFSPASLASPGSGVSTLTLSAGSQTAAGSYTVSVTANGGSLTQTAQLTVAVTPAGGLALTLGSSSVSLAQGAVALVGVKVSVTGSFRAPVSLSVTGAPSGLSVSLVPAAFPSPGSGSGTLMLNAGSKMAAGAYKLQVTASGGGATTSSPLSVTVTPPPGFTFTASPGSVTVPAGSKAVVTLSVSPVNGFNAPVTFTLSGLLGG